jgi:protein TilB
MTETTKRSITLPLIRKRSEHNEGLVSTLEELALHQEELQSIGTVLGRTCGKTLRILLLQNNVIERLDSSEMKYFKVLEYLNLALNNITEIEGLRFGMECLKKLDLTLNFIPVEKLESSVEELLSGCPVLEELFFIGNPCMRAGDTDGNAAATSSGTNVSGWNRCRSYIIAKLPSLKYLDGKEIKRSERILAMQQLPVLTEELRSLTKTNIEQQQTSKISPDDDVKEIGDDESTHHNPQTRTKISNEMYEQKQSKEKQESAHLVPQKGEKEWEEEHNATVQRVREREVQTKSEDDNHTPNSEIKQCNQGKWKFWFDESGTSKSGNLIMTIDLPKYLSTSLIDVDVHPTYVSIVIKSKILRVILPLEIVSDRAVAKRVASSGHLELIMPKMNPDEVAIGVPRVRSTDISRGEIGSHVNRKSDGKQRVTKRERLGQALMQEAITVESLGVIAAKTNGEDEEDEPPPLF